MGGSFNPLLVILKENKLVGTNYIDCKRNLNLVLTYEDYNYVLTDLCPPVPDSISTPEEDEVYHNVGFVDSKPYFSLVHGSVSYLN